MASGLELQVSPLPALVIVPRAECRFTSYRCAMCAGPASTDAPARELLLQSGSAGPLDLLEGTAVPELPNLDGSPAAPSKGKGKRRNAKQVGGAGGVSCSLGCGELFCSAECEAWARKHGGHGLLCVGPIDSLDHPLCVFRRVGASLGEEVLLAGQLLAAALQEAAAASSDGGSGGEEATVSSALATVRLLVARGLQKEESEGGGWEGDALAPLLAGLQDQHGVTEAHVRFVLLGEAASSAAGAAANGGGGGGKKEKGKKKGGKAKAGAAGGVAGDARPATLGAWRALLVAAERCAHSVELPSPLLAYCQQAMFADPSVLEAAGKVALPLLARMADRRVEEGGGAEDEDDDGEWEDDDEDDEREHEEEEGDDENDEEEGAGVAVGSAAPRRKPLSLWPAGWDPPLGERAEALVEPWRATAIFPLALPAAATTTPGAAGAAALAPLFAGDLPHSCLPTHTLRIDHVPIPDDASGGSSGGGGGARRRCLGLSLVPVAGAIKGSGGGGDGGSLSASAFDSPVSPSRCFVDAASGAVERWRELRSRFGAPALAAPPPLPAATRARRNEGGAAVQAAWAKKRVAIRCRCERCAWEIAALAQQPSSPEGPLGAGAGAGGGDDAIPAGLAATTISEAAHNSGGSGGGGVVAVAASAFVGAAAAAAAGGDPGLLRRLAAQAMAQERCVAARTGAFHAKNVFPFNHCVSVLLRRYGDALAAFGGLLSLEAADGDALYGVGVALRRLERWGARSASGTIATMHGHWAAAAEICPGHPGIAAAYRELVAYDVFQRDFERNASSSGGSALPSPPSPAAAVDASASFFAGVTSSPPPPPPESLLAGPSVAELDAMAAACERFEAEAPAMVEDEDYDEDDEDEGDEDDNNDNDDNVEGEGVVEEKSAPKSAAEGSEGEAGGGSGAAGVALALDRRRFVFASSSSRGGPGQRACWPVMSPAECAWAVAVAEAHAAGHGGWTTARHYAVARVIFALLT